MLGCLKNCIGVRRCAEKLLLVVSHHLAVIYTIINTLSQLGCELSLKEICILRPNISDQAQFRLLRVSNIGGGIFEFDLM